jgi:ABC-2 type transport system ATP-binding protein
VTTPEVFLPSPTESIGNVPEVTSHGAGGESGGDALRLTLVTKTYKSPLLRRRHAVVESLTCGFPRGACTGLLGHNGAGKTTTIKMMLGLTRPDSGKVLVFGAPASLATRRRIGYMPEVNKLPAALTAKEILRNQLLLHAPDTITGAKERRDAVAAALAAVGLTAHQNKRIGHLSKGMGRRLAWALSTIHRPDLLILDEPTSGLDPLVRREMHGWIEAEKARGTSIILCTHEMTEVQSLCDGFHILNAGRLVLTTLPPPADSEPAPLLKGGQPYQWRHRYTIHVSGASESQLANIGQIDRLLPWQGYKQEGYLAILGFAEYIDATAWLTALLAKGYVVVRFGDATTVGEEELLPYFKQEAPP